MCAWVDRKTDSMVSVAYLTHAQFANSRNTVARPLVILSARGPGTSFEFTVYLRTRADQLCGCACTCVPNTRTLCGGTAPASSR